MKKLLVAATLLAGTSAANAGLILVDSVNPAAASTVSIANNNEFKSLLGGLGVTTYTTGASLATDTAGSVSFYYYGKEAGYSNQFKATEINFSTGYTPYVNKFSDPDLLGSMEVGPGLLDFMFCAFSSPGSSVGCVSNAQNDALGMFSNQSIAMSLSGDTAWLFWDDSGAGPDDNHDDMLIKAVFTPASVPEPGTLALLALGLLGVGMSRRTSTTTIK